MTAREVKAYLDRYMTSNAWIRNRRHQDAVLTTRALSGLALASAGVGGEFPQRPELSVAGAAESQVAQGEKEEPDAVAAARDKAQPSPEEVESSLALEHGTRRLVQHGLASLGYAPGPADGLFGKRTREAIRRYQEAKGLDATGYLTAAQSQALAAVGEEARARAKAEADRAQAQRRADAERIERERRAKAPGHRFRDCDGTWCPELVVVPAGTFMMGSESEAGRIANEGPRHRVRIAKPFAVGVYEVTFEEWNACRRGGGCTHNPDDEGWGRGRRPVIDVSWEDAQAYVRWLSGETGEGYRLLSESEWEYVARAGTETPFHFGRTISTEQANYNGNFTYGSRRQGEYRERTVAVGGFSPNAFGLHDVHGNVWEWVEDCWNEDYTGAPSNGSSWESGDCSRRVLRGGSWNYGPRLLRSAYRDRYPAGDRGYFVGFRIARTLD